MNKPVTFSAPDLQFDTPAAARLRRVRRFKDQLTTASVGIGGVSVIIAIMLIFIYLLYEVLPLFESASIEPWQQQSGAVAAYARPGDEADTLYLGVEEQNEVAMRLDTEGQAYFFDVTSGELIEQIEVGLSEAPVGAFALNSDHSQLFALGHADGTLTVAKHHYKVTYPNDVRLITPQLQYPYGETALALSPALSQIDQLAFRDGEERMSAVALDGKALHLTRFSKEENFITEEIEISSEHYALPRLPHPVDKLLISPDQRWLYAVGPQGQLTPVDLRDPQEPLLHATEQATTGRIASVAFLLGGNSLLVGDDQGTVSQWFLVRDDSNEYHLQKIRSFDGTRGQPASLIVPEQRRKGFVVAEGGHSVSFYNATAHNKVLSADLGSATITRMTISPRANGLLLETDDHRMSFWRVNNEHPEVSWSALWEKVWYEGYQEPEFVWQSSASTNDFEPKYSLAPLAFGTLKAAFYAMLLATPLAIAGAIYTAYFMAPGLRRKIKPFIELMEALPTVILGFLAGLWLAPFVEDRLASIFTILLLVPVGILVFAYLWSRAPKALRWLVPDGWDAALLIPVIVLLTLACMPLAEQVEALLFGGDMRTYITNELGISFDQRNALVVGLAMGFAVIPTIFSITEDAIFSVPKHLSNGSLALGATPWQTLSRVVLPTASPGIFSAVMIGMGRAVGETMIVLMATGNTPIMDVNIFEGMRTLAANIAVEMPESEVGSSHFRILFLAALVLFLFTFVVNTLAELIRQRLRRKYGSL
ncbi:ABC transporter permease subunit [Motiliproteus sp. SC1-56]|uniref:ABC transporter permease subunit n=1 Tax=Motiliproteus sp. SC1-56 TaxID=2799565 RepID=UPI001A8D46B0|nr:ABC transporter permease subunit [Motiliproteus sp. SC1-56]